MRSLEGCLTVGTNLNILSHQTQLSLGLAVVVGFLDEVDIDMTSTAGTVSRLGGCHRDLNLLCQTINRSLAAINLQRHIDEHGFLQVNSIAALVNNSAILAVVRRQSLFHGLRINGFHHQRHVAVAIDGNLLSRLLNCLQRQDHFLVAQFHGHGRANAIAGRLSGVLIGNQASRLQRFHSISVQRQLQRIAIVLGHAQINSHVHLRSLITIAQALQGLSDSIRQNIAFDSGRSHAVVTGSRHIDSCFRSHRLLGRGIVVALITTGRGARLAGVAAGSSSSRLIATRLIGISCTGLVGVRRVSHAAAGGGRGSGSPRIATRAARPARAVGSAAGTRRCLLHANARQYLSRSIVGRHVGHHRLARRFLIFGEVRVLLDHLGQPLVDQLHLQRHGPAAHQRLKRHGHRFLVGLDDLQDLAVGGGHLADRPAEHLGQSGRNHVHGVSLTCLQVHPCHGQPEILARRRQSLRRQRLLFFLRSSQRRSVASVAIRLSGQRRAHARHRQHKRQENGQGFLQQSGVFPHVEFLLICNVLTPKNPIAMRFSD